MAPHWMFKENGFQRFDISYLQRRLPPKMLWVGPLYAVAVDAGAGYVWCKLPSHYVLSPVIDKSCQAGSLLTAHLTGSQLSSLGWEYWEQPASILRGERRGKACHKHWDHLTFSIQECVFRSSDADLGWLWAPPMNLSCMAIKIKANKKRFGWKMPDLELSPSLVSIILSLTSQQFCPGSLDITILSVAPDQIWYLYTPSDQAAGSVTKPSVIRKLWTKCLTKCGFSFVMAVTIMNVSPHSFFILVIGSWSARKH